MLERLFFFAGSSAGESALDIELSPVTIFVGPNSSGKSQALKEIERWAISPAPKDCVVIQRVGFKSLSAAETQRELFKISVPVLTNEHCPPDFKMVSRISPASNSVVRQAIHVPTLISEATSPNERSRDQLSSFLKMFTIRLDGKKRLELVDQQASGDMQELPKNIFSKLFKDNKLRSELRRIVYEAFGKYLVIDPTNSGFLRLRLSQTAPASEEEERGWHQAAVDFHKKAALVVDAGDGVKAFIGMMATIIAGNPKITLIDEPEAFLHPSLSTRLGKEICVSLEKREAEILDESSDEIDGSTIGKLGNLLFVATHSASFLMGCVQSNVHINIIRLTYSPGAATARHLSKSKLTPLMRNPLLRSIGVLNALFHSAVIVTEGDADRAFYQEINERLLSENDIRGIDSCLFLNAQNKQTVWDIVRPLRELGVLAVGIVDIDVLKEGGTVWKKLLKGSFIPSISYKALETERNDLKFAFDATGKNMKRDGGVDILPNDIKDACNSLFDRLAGYGVFVVRRGEVEAWLSNLNISRNKEEWLKNIFESMGEDPKADGYVKPSDGDVWDFLGDISKWMINNNRSGLPN